MRYLKCAIVLSLCLALAAVAVGDEKKPQEKAAATPKKTRPSVEAAIRRAASRARDTDGQHLARLTALPSMALDDPSYLVLCEFSSGDVAIFQGGADDEADEWVIVEKKQLDALEEITKRCRR